LIKFNNRSKKSNENLENTLGEREPLRFEDSEEGRGVKSPRNRMDSVEKTQNHLESPWPPQEMEWKRKKGLGF
jgi:hypothetical protein